MAISSSVTFQLELNISSTGAFYIPLAIKSSVDEIGERYRLNHAIVVKLCHRYTQFPRNVRLSYRRLLLGLEGCKDTHVKANNITKLTLN